MKKWLLIFLLFLCTGCKPETKNNQNVWLVKETVGNCIFPVEGYTLTFKPDKLIFYCNGNLTEKESVITSTRIITSLYAGKQVFEITRSGDSIIVLTEKYSPAPIKIILSKKSN